AVAEAHLVLVGGRASVAAQGVSVVALLAGGHDTIATAGGRAVRIATVAVHQIPIVAALAAGRVEHAIPAHEPGLRMAGRRATVAAPPVAVVTLLAGRDDGVAAARGRAVRVASVAVDEVPVVARFAAGHDHTVAADERRL